MHFLALVGVVLLLVAAVELGLIASPFARVKLIVTAGRVVIAKGSPGARARELVADILRAANVSGGFITISSGGKVRFSRSIPRSLRQQLRNVLLL